MLMEPKLTWRPRAKTLSEIATEVQADIDLLGVRAEVNSLQSGLGLQDEFFEIANVTLLDPVMTLKSGTYFSSIDYPLNKVAESKEVKCKAVLVHMKGGVWILGGRSVPSHEVVLSYKINLYTGDSA